MGETVVRAADLTKYYGRQRGIIDLELEIAAGEVFGYLGPNGAGKTTTIRLLLDFLRPSRGSASLFGLDSHRDSLAIRRRVGYLPGDLRLYESLSGRELIDYFGRLRGGVSRARVDSPVRTSRLRPASRDPSAVVRQPPEGRPDPGADERSRAAHPGRADEWPRSARPADVLRAGRRGPGGWANRAPVVARAAGGRAGLRPRRDHPGGQARRRGADRRSPRPGDAPPGDRVLPGRSRRRVREGRRCPRPHGCWPTSFAAPSSARWTRSSRPPTDTRFAC